MAVVVIEKKIYVIRGLNVMLDFDLAALYEIETKRLKEAVRRNINRFPDDFMFALNRDEYNSLRSQFASLNKKSRGEHSKYNPFAFTEQGMAMLSSVLHSDKAIEVNMSIMRAFVFIRHYALSHKDLTSKLKKLESKYNIQFKDVYKALDYLLEKDKQQEELSKRKRIGFKIPTKK